MTQINWIAMYEKYLDDHNPHNTDAETEERDAIDAEYEKECERAEPNYNMAVALHQNLEMRALDALYTKERDRIRHLVFTHTAKLSIRDEV